MNLLLPLDASPVGVVANPAARDEGYLIFTRQGALLAQSFDFSRGQPLGEPLRLAQQVKIAPRGSTSDIQASVSANGVLVLVEGGANNHLTWVDRAGKKLGTLGSSGIYSVPRISRDDQRLAVGCLDPQTLNQDIHLFDLARKTEQRFTDDAGVDNFPIWSSDGNRIVWTSNRDGAGNLYWKAASGAGPDEALHRSDYLKRALDWSADGRFILYTELDPQTSSDLWVLPLEGGQPWPWLKTQFNESFGRFSPDGKWIAYPSNESGRNEIYLQAFAPGAPASGGRWRLSTSGGSLPLWRRDGRELYYNTADNKLMAVEVTLSEEVKYGTPKELFALDSLRVETIGRGRAMTGDGQRFLFTTIAEETTLTPFTVVQNWMAEMKK
jgi:Tol biopolymer transport system component